MSWYLLDPWRLVQSDFGRRGEEAEGICSCTSQSMPEVVKWANGSKHLLLSTTNDDEEGKRRGIRWFAWGPRALGRSETLFFITDPLRSPHQPYLPLPLLNRHQQVRQDSLFDWRHLQYRYP